MDDYVYEIVRLKKMMAYNWLIEITLDRISKYDEEHCEINTLYVDNDEDGFIHDVVVGGTDEASQFPNLKNFLKDVNYIVLYDKYTNQYLIRAGKKRHYFHTQSIGTKEEVDEAKVKEFLEDFCSGLNEYLNKVVYSEDHSEYSN